MAAISTAANRLKRGVGKVRSYKLAAVSVPKGALVAINAAGFATNGADTAGFLGTVGVAAESVDNSAGSAGDKRIKVDFDCEFLFTASSITQAMVGTAMYTVDNNTVDDAAGPTNDIAVGKLTEFVSTTQGWVYVPGLTT